MSKNNNVNPGQYTTAGRERPDDIARERMKSSRQQLKGSAPARTARKKKTAR